jgi:hypothetical protein
MPSAGAWGNGLCRSSDTAIPHMLLFPGMAGRHLGARCRQRRATGGFGAPSFRSSAAEAGISLLSG